MKHFLVFIFLLLAALNVTWARPPVNVVLILVDDLGYGDLSVTGNPYMSTPNIDFLARNGINFRNFYVSPVCAPTRASLLTGKYHQRTGVQSVTNGYEMLNPQEVTLAEILQGQNYRTALFGKWHLGEYYPSVPLAQGFDEFCGFMTGHTDEYFDPQLEADDTIKKFAGFITDILTDRAIEFITEKDDSPFFCYLAYNAPHTPLQVDSVYFQPFLEKGLDERTARIYGLIQNLDENIGRLMTVMQEHHLQENTLVIFMSDNGPISGWQVAQQDMRYNAGLRDQKFTVYEGGVRTPCFWYAPDYFPPHDIETVAAHIDVLPTILDVLGIPDAAAGDRDGQSLLPFIFNGPSERHFFQKFSLNSLGESSFYPGGIVRKGRWKMVNGEELYALDQDPGEAKDLSAGHEYKLAELRSIYESWWNSVVEEHSLEKIPIEIGYSESPRVVLKPHHAVARGNLKFEGRRGLTGDRLGYHPSGVDGDWVVGWRQEGDRLSWEITVVESGVFDFNLIGSGWSAWPDYLHLVIENEQAQIDKYSFHSDELVIKSVFLEKGHYILSIEVINLNESGNPLLKGLSVFKK